MQTEQFQLHPEDRLLFQIQGVISEFEREKIIERSRRGKLYKAKKLAKFQFYLARLWVCLYLLPNPKSVVTKFILKRQPSSKRIFHRYIYGRKAWGNYRELTTEGSPSTCGSLGALSDLAHVGKSCLLRKAAPSKDSGCRKAQAH
ncbi:MAG: recombinase family protein [Bdellovibrionales bacterium]|nr:recombinase family protein [Bdellovibrionales bacterium]